MKIKGQQDFWSGILFISFGILALVIARDYPIGEARRMGPGFFPTYIGIALLILGIIIAGMGLKIDGEKIGSFKRAWRPVFLMSLAFMVFATTIDLIGFVPALACVSILSAAAGREFKIKEALIMSFFLILGCVGIFVYGLGLSFPLFKGW